MTSPFCEGRYFYQYPFPFVDEFVNAASSVALTVAALGPPYPPRLGAPLWLARTALGVCGIGSTLYHARLSSLIWKWTDEIPMVIISASLATSLLFSTVRPQWKGTVIAAATLYSLTTVLIDITVTTTLVPFQVLFVAPFIGMIPLLWNIWYRLHRWLPGIYVRRLYTQLAAATTIGTVSWLIDMHACNAFVATLRMHAWWHIAVAFVAYLLIVIASLARGKVLLEWRGSFPVMIEKPLLVMEAEPLHVMDATEPHELLSSQTILPMRDSVPVLGYLEEESETMPAFQGAIV